MGLSLAVLSRVLQPGAGLKDPLLCCMELVKCLIKLRDPVHNYPNSRAVMPDGISVTVSFADH